MCKYRDFSRIESDEKSACTGIQLKLMGASRLKYRQIL